MAGPPGRPATARDTSDRQGRFELDLLVGRPGPAVTMSRPDPSDTVADIALRFERSDFHPLETVVHVPLRFDEGKQVEERLSFYPLLSGPDGNPPVGRHRVLEVVVTKPDGKPLRAGRIVAHGVDNEFFAEAETDRQGRAELMLLEAPPNVIVVASADGLESSPRRVKLESTVERPGFALKASGTLSVAPTTPIEVNEVPSFLAGHRALENRDWQTAVTSFSRAMDERYSSGGRLLVDRGREISYLPYLGLGIALFNIGEYQEALAAFDTELSLQAVFTDRDAISNLKTYRRMAQTHLEKMPTRVAATPTRPSSTEPGDRAAAAGADEPVPRAAGIAEIDAGTDPVVEARIEPIADLISLESVPVEREDAAAVELELQRHLDQAIAELQAGRTTSAVAVLNRAIAIDPSSEPARRLLMQAYGALNRSLPTAAATGLAPVLPPVLLLSQPVATAGETLRRSRPRLEVAAIVLDDQPVIRVRCCTPAAEETTLSGELTGALYRFDLAQTVRLAPGSNVMALEVRDSDGLRAESRRSIVFARPWFRTSWFTSLVVLVLLLATLALWLPGYARRRRLLRRRFNPFVAGAPILDNDLFFGREATIERILQTLGSNHILIHGERRIGKTSLLHQLADRLRALQDPEVTFVPVYADVEGVAENEVLRVLREDIVEAFRSAGITTDDGSDPAGGDEAERLVETAKSMLGRLQTVDGKTPKIALLIDESDQLLTYSPATRDRLRRLIVGPLADHLVVLLSGVGIGQAAEAGDEPLLALFDRLELEGLVDEDAEQLIRDPIRGVFRVEDGVVARLLELTRRKPYQIQRLCVALVNRCHELGKRSIEVADVDLLHSSGALGGSASTPSGSSSAGS